MLHEKAPQLRDIDGGICHHIQNTNKEFCSPFNNFLEHLLDNLHADSKFSTDIRQASFEYQVLSMMIKYHLRFASF